MILLRRRRVLILVLLFVSAGAGVLLAQQTTPDTPAWVYYAKAQRLLDAGSLGEALATFRQALAAAPATKFPEAQVGIGVILEREGESTLAEQAFLQAVAQRGLLYVRQEYYVAWYHLADIYKRQMDYAKYENALKSVVDDDQTFSSQIGIPLEAYRSVLEKDGLSKLLLLYRLPDDFSLDAHKQLGIFYVSSGRYTPALDNMIFATLKILTECVTEVGRIDPSYQYTTVPDLLDRVKSSTDLSSYVQKRGLFECMYFLAAALYGEGRTIPALDVWRLVASRSEAGAWADRSRAKAAHPQIEPQIKTQ